jgi:hypothetical protein
MTIAVDVYRFGDVQTTRFGDNLKAARKFAEREFDSPGVYKVKVWDLSKRGRQPNLVGADNLIFELV